MIIIEHCYHLYPIQVDFENIIYSKINFFEYMKSYGINLQNFIYIPIHLQPYYKTKFGFKSGDFPNSEYFYNNEISLPIYPTLSSR